MPDTQPAPYRGEVTRIVLTVLSIGLLIAASLWVLLPFLGSLLWATTIVVATWPLMRGLQKRLGGSRGAATAVMTLILLLVLFVPLYLAVSTVVEQSDRIADLVRALPTMRLPAAPAWIEGVPLVGPKLAERWTALAALESAQLKEQLSPYLKSALAWFAAHAGSFGSMVIHFLLTVAIAAILYVKGEGAAEQLRRFFRRLAADRGEAIVELSGKAIRAVALGIVVTAMIQAALSAIGLVAAGVPFPGLLSALIFVFCITQIGPLIPLAGCVIWLYATGSPGRGTVLLVFSVVAVTIDNVLRPVLIKKGVDLSFLLILPGVIGGVLWLGILGLFVGPVVLAVASTLINSWIEAGLGEPASSAAGVAPDAVAAAAPQARHAG